MVTTHQKATKRRRSRSTTLAELIDKAAPVIVGLWRFRRANEKTPQWCTTWRFKGNYYDTYPKPSPVLALQALLRNWKEVSARSRTNK